MELTALKTALETAAPGLTVLSKLGEGGEGEVFLARLEVKGGSGSAPREVALKVLRAAKPERLKLALRLKHPRIVEALATGEVLGSTYLLMEYFPGEPLRERLSRGPLPLPELRVILLGLAEALEHAHGRGIVHQDVKPENVLVQEAGGGIEIKLADFGLATELEDETRRALLLSRSLRSGEEDDLRALAGTLPYLAPERLESSSREPDARTDIYALGVLIFEMLTGRPPSGLELPSELRSDLDPRWDRILKRALARDPEKRFSRVSELRSEVMPVLARVPALPGTKRLGESSARPVLVEAPAPLPPVRQPPPLPLDDMIVIPAGKVRLGDASSPEASPVSEVELASFKIDRTPVTNAAYHAFVLATGARPPRTWGGARNVAPRALPRAQASLPVTGVTWDEAAAFAAWAGKRLPTEAEWERAARGTSGRSFPYGDAFDAKKINTDQKALAPVTAHPEGASDEGVLDLTGNAWEWCSSVHAPYPPPKAPLAGKKGDARVIRGGYDPARPGSGSAWFRAALRHDVANPRVGFRCAKEVS